MFVVGENLNWRFLNLFVQWFSVIFSIPDEIHLSPRYVIRSTSNLGPHPLQGQEGLIERLVELLLDMVSLFITVRRIIMIIYSSNVYGRLSFSLLKILEDKSPFL